MYILDNLNAHVPSIRLLLAQPNTLTVTLSPYAVEGYMYSQTGVIAHPSIL